MAIKKTYNSQKVHAILMRGRPDETESWQSIAVYSERERDEYCAQGWKKSLEFMESADRARRRDN